MVVVVVFSSSELHQRGNLYLGVSKTDGDEMTPYKREEEEESPLLFSPFALRLFELDSQK